MQDEVCQNRQVPSKMTPNSIGPGIMPSSRTSIHCMPRANDRWSLFTHLTDIMVNYSLRKRRHTSVSFIYIRIFINLTTTTIISLTHKVLFVHSPLKRVWSHHGNTWSLLWFYSYLLYIIEMIINASEVHNTFTHKMSDICPNTKNIIWTRNNCILTYMLITS